MRSYLSLVPISAKVHKRQSRMTRICIILAVFLVTSIFSMADMWTDAETTAMRHNHGDWHIALQNVSEDEAEQIRKNSGVAVSSWYDEINTDAEQNYYIDGKNAVLYGIEESYITDIMRAVGMPATLTTEASTLQSKSGSHLQDLGSVSCMQNHVPGKARARLKSSIRWWMTLSVNRSLKISGHWKN